MFVDLTPGAARLRLKVRDYFQTLMTSELRRLRAVEAATYKHHPQDGRDGWLASAGRRSTAARVMPATEQLIFFEEANIAGAPLPFVTISTVGPALMEFGTDKQKAKFLPGIAAGEILFSPSAT